MATAIWRLLVGSGSANCDLALARLLVGPGSAHCDLGTNLARLFRLALPGQAVRRL